MKSKLYNCPTVEAFRNPLNNTKSEKSAEKRKLAFNFNSKCIIATCTELLHRNNFPNYIGVNNSQNLVARKDSFSLAAKKSHFRNERLQ